MYEVCARLLRHPRLMYFIVASRHVLSHFMCLGVRTLSLVACRAPGTHHAAFSIFTSLCDVLRTRACAYIAIRSNGALRDGMYCLLGGGVHRIPRD
jgi:hypothetical protein